MVKLSLRSLLVSFIVTALLTLGLVPPAYAAATAYSTVTNSVRPGLTNEFFAVIFDGLPPINSMELVLSGITVSAGSQQLLTSYELPGSSARACGSTIGFQSNGASPIPGSCQITASQIGWYAQTTASVGGKFYVTFPAGSFTFASSGPWTITPRYHDGSQSVTLADISLVPNFSPQSALSLTSTTGTFGTPLTLTTSGGTTNGTVTYAISSGGTASGCSVSGNSLTTTSAGTCLVTATMAGNATYAPVSSSPTTVTLAKASRTLSFATTSYSLSYGATQQVTATPLAGNGSLSYLVSSGTACTVSSTGLVTVTASSGTCQVDASITEGTSYLAVPTATTPVTITVGVASITITASSPSISYGSSVNSTFAVTSGTLVSPDAITSVTFRYSGSGSTAYGPTEIAPTAPGTYSVTPQDALFSPGSSSNYTINYAASTFTISKAQASLSFSGGTTRNVQFGDTTTVLATSNGDGTITYSVGASEACSVGASTGVVTVTAASGTCLVNATIAEGTNYLTATTGTPVLVTVSKRSISITASSTSVTVGNTLSPSFELTSGSLVGSDAISGVTYNYAGSGSTTYASNTTAPTAIGSYSVTPSAPVFSSGLRTNYEVTFIPGTFSINAKLTRTLGFATLTYSLEYGDTQTVVATPSTGLNDGTITYSAGSSSACTVNSATGVITVTASSGTCAVSASITESPSYLAATSSAPVTVTVSARALTITATNQTIPLSGVVDPEFTITTGTLVGSDEITTVTNTFAGKSPLSFGPSTTPPTASGTYSITPSGALFSTGSVANYAITYVAGTLSISAPATPTLELEMSAQVGASLAGTRLTFSGVGLQDGASYSVVVRSTPKTLASGTAVEGSVNGSATIPAGLGAGWHTLTFSSTAANGSEAKRVMYFEVSASGILLEKTTVMPAELAITGAPEVTHLGIVSTVVMLTGLLLIFLRWRRTN